MSFNLTTFRIGTLTYRLSFNAIRQASSDANTNVSAYDAKRDYYVPSSYKKFRSEPGRRFGYKAKHFTGGKIVK